MWAQHAKLMIFGPEEIYIFTYVAAISGFTNDIQKFPPKRKSVCKK